MTRLAVATLFTTALYWNSIAAQAAPPPVSTGNRSTAGTVYNGGSYYGNKTNPLLVDGFGLTFAPTANPVAGLVPFNYHGSPGYPVFGVWGGIGGDVPPSAYGYYPQSYVAQEAVRTFRARQQRTPAPLPLTVTNPQPATLSLMLPGAGEVWANGVKSGNHPNAEWTLQSPELGPGESFTFDVKARWEVDGKNYEYTRAVTVEGGKSSQIQVLGGTVTK